MGGEGKAIWTTGDTYTVKASSEDTGDTLSVVEASVPPGGGPPPHVHRRSDEAFYLLEGELELDFIGDRTFVANAGSFVFIPQGVPHRFQNIGTQPAKMLAIGTPAGLEKFLEAVGQPAGGGAAPPPSPEEIEKAIAVGPRYDLELVLPREA